MSMRHRAVKATLDRGYAIEWNDDHEDFPIARYEYKITAFLNALTNFWDLTQETSGTATTIALTSGRVIYVLNATGGAGNISTIRHKVLNAAGDVTSTAALPKLTMDLQVGGLTADALTHEFGFFNNADTPFTATQEGAYFRISSNVLYAVTGTGAAETATNLGAPDAYATYRVEINSADVKFYIDDNVTPVATHTTNLPTGNLNIKLSCAQRAGGSNTINCDVIILNVLSLA